VEAAHADETRGLPRAERRGRLEHLEESGDGESREPCASIHRSRRRVACVSAGLGHHHGGVLIASQVVAVAVNSVAMPCRWHSGSTASMTISPMSAAGPNLAEAKPPRRWSTSATHVRTLASPIVARTSAVCLASNRRVARRTGTRPILTPGIQRPAPKRAAKARPRQRPLQRTVEAARPRSHGRRQRTSSTSSPFHS
jgi:hypothetical protein